MDRVCLPARAFTDRRIRGAHMRALAAISLLGEGALSQRQIAAECGVADRDLRRTIRDLAEFGYLDVTFIEGMVSVYRIAFSPGDPGGKHPGGENIPRGINSPPGEKSADGVSSPQVPLSPPAPPLTPLNPPTSVTTQEARAKRLSKDFVMPLDWIDDGAAAREKAHLPPSDLATEAIKFVNHWLSKSGRDGAKLDWHRTWINWCLNAKGFGNGQVANGRASAADNLIEGFGRAAGFISRSAGNEPDWSSAGPLLDGEYARRDA